MNSHSTKQGT